MRRNSKPVAWLAPIALCLGLAAALALPALRAGAARPASPQPDAKSRGTSVRSGRPMPDTVLAQVADGRFVTLSDFHNAWRQVDPPGRPDSLTPVSARKFLDLLIGKESLAEVALGQPWTWTDRELPNTGDIEWETSQSALFRWRVLPLRLGIVLPLAVAGALLLGREWRGLVLLAAPRCHPACHLRQPISHWPSSSVATSTLRWKHTSTACGRRRAIQACGQRSSASSAATGWTSPSSRATSRPGPRTRIARSERSCARHWQRAGRAEPVRGLR